MINAKPIGAPPRPAEAELIWLRKQDYERFTQAYEDMRWFASRVLGCPLEAVTTTAMWQHLKPKEQVQALSDLPPPPVESTHGNGAHSAPPAPSAKTESPNGL